MLDSEYEVIYIYIFFFCLKTKEVQLDTGDVSNQQHNTMQCR